MTTVTTVRHGVPFNDYAAIDAVNHSAIERGRQSMAHMEHYIRHPECRAETPALTFGRWFHTALLEPNEWFPLVAPDSLDRRTKEGKAAWLGLEVADGGKGQIVRESELASIEGMVSACHNHPAVRGIVATKGRRETVMEWTDEETGLRCKCRIDWYAAGLCFCDVKSTRNASPDLFEASIARYGYHRQVAWYMEGGLACAGLEMPYTLVAVEKEPPFAVSIVQLDKRAIGVGAKENREVLTKYAAARAAGRFPAYPEIVQICSLPGWYKEHVWIADADEEDHPF